MEKKYSPYTMVMVDGKVYNSDETPIVLILGHDNKKHISDMGTENRILAIFPSELAMETRLELIDKARPYAYEEGNLPKGVRSASVEHDDEEWNNE